MLEPIESNWGTKTASRPSAAVGSGVSASESHREDAEKVAEAMISTKYATRTIHAKSAKRMKKVWSKTRHMKITRCYQLCKTGTVWCGAKWSPNGTEFNMAQEVPAIEWSRRCPEGIQMTQSLTGNDMLWLVQSSTGSRLGHRFSRLLASSNVKTNPMQTWNIFKQGRPRKAFTTETQWPQAFYANILWHRMRWRNVYNWTFALQVTKASFC